MGAEQVSDPRNSTWLPKAFKKQDVSNSQLADGVFCTACPTEGEADWTIVYKDEHEEEFLQSDDDIVKKVMNEASTLLNVVTTGKAPTEDSACRKRVSARTDLPSHCFHGSSCTARGRKEDRHGATIACTPKESRTNKRHDTFVVAPKHRGFIQNMTTGALQADNRVISMRVHKTALRHPVVSTPNVEAAEIDDGRIGELTKVRLDWREGLRDLAQSRQQLQRGTRRSQKPSAARR